MPTQMEIESILSDMRQAIKSNRCFLVPRKANQDTLAQLGITSKDAFDEIYHLTYRDYYSGPMTDRDQPDTDSLWVFKKAIEGEIIYIKFKIEYQKNKTAKFLSFHIDRIGI